MYLEIFGSSLVLATVAGAAVAAALIYEYYAFKQRERESSMNHSVYSVLESDHFEWNSITDINLRRRMHRTDINRGSSSIVRTEGNERASSKISENVLNSNLNVLEATDNSACDDKLLGDVARNSECDEKHYEKNVFNKVKNDLTYLNQHLEEKEISDKNLNVSSCVNYDSETTVTSNFSVKYNVIEFGEISQNHSNCEEDAFCNPQGTLPKVNNIATSSAGHDECEIHQIGINKLNCSDKVDDNLKYLFHSAHENKIKNDDVHQSDRQEINSKSSNREESKVLNSSIWESLHSSSTLEVKLLANKNNNAKHKFNYINMETANTVFDGDILNSQFENQKENIKYPNQVHPIKLLNFDSSYTCSPSAELKEHAFIERLKFSSATSPTVGLNEHKHHSSLQLSAGQEENAYHSSIPSTSSNVCNKETCNEISDRHKLYNQYKKRVVYDNNAIYNDETKVINNGALAAKYVPCKTAVDNSLNVCSYPQLSFNTVSNIETSKSKHIDQSKKINIGGETSNSVENILTSSVNAVNQYPALSSFGDPKNPIYLRTTEQAFLVSGKERGTEIVNCQATNRRKIHSDHASSSFISHLYSKYMPELQSYASSIRSFVKKHKALLSEAKNSNRGNTASSNNESDTDSEADNVDMDIQVSLVCDSESDELNNHISKPQLNLCKGCMEVEANVVSVPCGHSYFCIQCAEITSKIYKKCCICHNRVTSFERMTI